MGKTLEVLALILQDTDRRRAVCTPDGSNKKTFHVKSSATLIIVPMTLLSQWLLEVDKCTRQGTVKVGVYNHGDMTKGLKKKLTDLADCDIVFAHYGDLERATHLRKVHWRRILLDECQMIRSSTTQIAKNCRSLVSQHRWLVSGTPLYSGIGDLNGILAFLKIYPFSLSDSEDGFFGLRVGQPFAAKSANSLKLVMELCDKIIMRHSKRQRHLGTSKPILELPGSTFAHQPIRLTTHLKYTALVSRPPALALFCFADSSLSLSLSLSLSPVHRASVPPRAPKAAGHGAWGCQGCLSLGEYAHALLDIGLGR